MKRDVDIREDVCANVVLSSGTTNFQRIGEHVTVDFCSIHDEFQGSCFTREKVLGIPS